MADLLWRANMQKFDRLGFFEIVLARFVEEISFATFDE